MLLQNMNNTSRDELIQNNKSGNLYYAITAKVSFVILIFSIFFGTQLPFQEIASTIEDIGTSNIVNQLVYTPLFIISIIILFSKRNEVLIIIKREKYFFIFLLWCLLTVIWSEHPLVSFKRYIQYLSTITVTLSMLLYSRNSEESLKIFYYIAGLYILISMAAIFTIPGAGGMDDWRGIATDKNNFGQISLISLIIF